MQSTLRRFPWRKGRDSHPERPVGRYSLSGRAPRLAGPLPRSPRLESNQWPPRSERGALSAELQGEGGRRGNTRLVLGHSTSRRPQSPHHESNVAAGLRGANGRSAAEEVAPLAGADPATSGVTGRRSSVELQRRALPPTRTEITGVRARSVAVTTAGRRSVELESNQHSLLAGGLRPPGFANTRCPRMQGRD